MTRRLSEIWVACSLILALGAVPAMGQEESGDAVDLDALRAEVEALRGSLPSQSHTMADVEFHFANLWFAGKNGNWPLATFYLNETRSHLNWTVRIRPVRRVSTGEFDLRPMLASVEASGLAGIKQAIDDEDADAFDAAYRAMMGQCYACHVAAEKPFLEPHIPETPPSPMMNHPLAAAAR